MSSLKSESLSHYFAGPDAGDASNYLGMCAVALAGSLASVDCRACSGKGYRELKPDELQKWAARIAAQETTEHRDQVRRQLSRASDCAVCRGIGKVTAHRGDHAAAMDSMWTTVRCGTCRGSGEVVNPTDMSAERGDVCLVCGGDAYIVPVTVRCGKHHDTGGGASGGDSGAPLLLPAAEPASAEEEPTDRHRVARELEAVRAQDPQLAAALASYHGPEGDRWVGHRWGRGFAIWQHTEAGRQLAEHVAAQSVRGSGYLVDPTARIAQVREAQQRPLTGRPPSDHQLKRVLVSRADQEARELQRRVLAFTHENAA